MKCWPRSHVCHHDSLQLTEPKATLAATLALVEDRLHQPRGGFQGLLPTDVLLVPDLFSRITQRFVELEGRPCLNAGLEGQRMDVAEQDILFRLHRRGAELKSEAKMYTLGGPAYYVFDRSFLICMKKPGAKRPYFVMWVDNAELLEPFSRGPVALSVKYFAGGLGHLLTGSWWLPPKAGRA